MKQINMRLSAKGFAEDTCYLLNKLQEHTGNKTNYTCYLCLHELLITPHIQMIIAVMESYLPFFHRTLHCFCAYHNF